MVNTQFEMILKEFEPFFNCPLVCDENEACVVKMGIGIEVQIEWTRHGVMVGSRLGQVVGRYSELLFKQALKSNALTPPSTGAFGYSQNNKNLIIFMFLDSRSIRADDLPSVLTPFILKAKKWHEAIQNGEVPTLEETETSSSSRLFGL